MIIGSEFKVERLQPMDTAYNINQYTTVVLTKSHKHRDLL